MTVKARTDSTGASSLPAGFDLSAASIDVAIEDATRGKVYALTHTFRSPTDEEWLNYMRDASGLRVVDGKPQEIKPLQAELDLWQACITGVRGYLWEGAELMDKRQDWRALIPAQHRYYAARGLLAVRQKLLEGPLA